MAFVLAAVPGGLLADDWLRFRGPNGSGVNADSDPPIEFGPGRNLRWKAAAPQAASSVVVAGGRVFLTAAQDDELTTFALDADSGERLWSRTVQRARQEKFHPRHSGATPTPASDGEFLYVFFPELGLLSYTFEGEERWRTPLGPFSSVQGIATSPIVADGKVILLVDQTLESYVAAFGADDGNEIWKTARPTDFLGGYSTPVVRDPDDGPAEAIVAGSVTVAAYQLETGEELWSLPGWLSPVGVPVLGDDALYVSEPLNQEPPAFSLMLSFDKDEDEALSTDEVEEFSGVIRLVERIDTIYGDGDGKVVSSEWNQAFEEYRGAGGLAAIGLNGDEAAEDSIVWRYQKSLPYLASILLYKGLVYAVRDGGIVTALDAETGAAAKQGRLPDAPGEYYASPIAAGGRIYFSSTEGKVAVVKAGREWEALAVNDLGEPIQATPAIASDRLYVRTHEAVYCFETESVSEPDRGR